ncbi:MAG: class I tRNA ligase family protein, partial [Deltaproteobacteria bacterium]|nr:class I tRNA ligase family protein [Deltaproteobacteria bacterium]
MDLHVYSTISRDVVPFIPLDPKGVKIYTCGPTVYRYAHIGNLRTYLMSDILVRVLRHLSHDVYHVKNITDVGHMRQEMLERGEDKVIAAARAARKSPEEIARFFTEAFLRDEERLNLIPADLYPRASEHIPEMIDLVSMLVDKGFTYEMGGTIYFDIGKYAEYGRLSGNLPGELREGHRIESDHHKRHPEDFSLWKIAEPGRELKWDSPWGEGFPGWHIECAAMAIKYLGNEFDFHLGGIDLVFPHHENEIAQARCAIGGDFARYWLHGGHL